MDTRSLELFATQARRELIAAVEAQASAVLSDGSVARSERGETVTKLEAEIKQHGQKHVINKVAYTWFNRLIALRYMDALGYTGVGVVSPAQGHAYGQPEILADAKRGHLDDEVIVNERTRDAVMGLLDGSRRSTDPEGEAYALLLTEYCRFWNKAMPFMFEREGDYTELLVPSGLLADGSVLSRAREVLTEDVCEDVEVIGWLYQFYISERKDEVFAGFKKNKKAGADEIPAATQLFTPHWIVRYLVENSVGRIWMLNKPDSRLVDQMDYYIEPVDETTDVLKINGPEELTVIDPACGSGHMLTYAFDLLYEIYAEEGYAPSEIPTLILTHNLHGTEIDPRAGALAAFALTMKARQKDRRFLSRQVKSKICVIEPASFDAGELDFLVTKTEDRHAEEAFWNQFRDADTLGSLIRPDRDDVESAAGVLSTLHEDLIYGRTLQGACRVVQQAEILSAMYAVVVANPPYMGGKQMNALLSQFMKDEYPDSKSDLFAAFIERCAALALPCGTAAMITMQSWMFLSSYEKLRSSLLSHQQITSMLHLGTRAFDSIGGEVVSSTAFALHNRSAGSIGSVAGEKGTFIRLVDGSSEAEKIDALCDALDCRNADSGYHYASSVDFEVIPGSPIVYWLSEKMLATFSIGQPLGNISTPLVGLRTGDNARFMRQWWEVSHGRTSFDCDSLQAAKATGSKWFPYNKGGAFRRWYGNHEYVVNWERDGREVEESLAQRYPYLVPSGKTLVRGQGRDRYFSPSVSWSKISSGAPAFRAYPPGFIFDVAGTSIFARSQRERAALIAFTNSRVAYEQLAALAPTLNFEVGQVAGLPVIDQMPEGAIDNVALLIEQSKADWDTVESSWNFDRNPLVKFAQVDTNSTIP